MFSVLRRSRSARILWLWALAMLVAMLWYAQPRATSAVTPTPTSTSTPGPVGDLGWQTITGKVFYQSFDMVIPLAGATVTCSHFSYYSHPHCSGTRTTDSDGNFSFGTVFLHDTDSITVKASAPGYQDQSIIRGGVATFSNPAFYLILQPSSQPTATPTPAIGPCQVTYQIASQWANGFTANVAIKNTGTATINSWTLDWSFPNGQQITSYWSALVTQTGATVVAQNLSWNAAIGLGLTVSFGFQGTHSGTNLKPSSFRLNGMACSIGV